MVFKKRALIDQNADAFAKRRRVYIFSSLRVVKNEDIQLKRGDNTNALVLNEDLEGLFGLNALKINTG